MAQDSASDLERRLAQAERQLSEALERQAASDEVLRVIASSPGELGPVFDAMLANATRICEAKLGTLVLREGDELRVVAMHGAPRAFEELRQRDPWVPSTVRRMYETKEIIHCANLAAEEAYANLPLVRVAGVRLRVGPPATGASAPAPVLPSARTRALGHDLLPLALSQQPSPPRA